jgi:hypothetical protein
VKPLLVGEANPYAGDALAPWPRGAAGDRLRRILGLEDDAYLEAFARINLCLTTWDRRSARDRATRLQAEWPGPIVLLGVKVSAAFDLAFEPFARRGRVLILPHPSGRNRMWDAPGTRHRARRAIRGMIVAAIEEGHKDA